MQSNEENTKMSTLSNGDSSWKLVWEDQFTGSKIDDTNCPQKMEIDYIKVFQK